jgi:citrate synthase
MRFPEQTEMARSMRASRADGGSTDAAPTSCAARAYVRAAIERGEPMLGLGHPLYPGGDVRALALLKALKPGAKISRALRVAENEVGGAANVDMALAAMTRELRLPDDAPFVIFAAGRMAGWLAHAIEQRETGRLIRPRARYTGL